MLLIHFLDESNEYSAEQMVKNHRRASQLALINVVYGQLGSMLFPLIVAFSETVKRRMVSSWDY